MDEKFLCSYLKRISFGNERYTEGVPFLSKIGHKRVKEWDLGAKPPRIKLCWVPPRGVQVFVPNSLWLSRENRKYLRLCCSLVVVTYREDTVKPTNILWTLPFQTSHESWVFYILKNYTRLYFLNYQNSGIFLTLSREVSLEQFFRISFTDSKIRTALYSIINSTTANYCWSVHSPNKKQKEYWFILTKK